MSLKKNFNWWDNFIDKLNTRGVPIPMLRYKGEANPAFTMFIISSALVIVGIVGKWAGHLGGIDIGAAMQFFYASSTLFFGHSWVHKEEEHVDPNVLNGDDQNKGPT